VESNTKLPEESKSKSKLLSRVPRWALISPFFLSSVFFLSGLFTLFSPLPVLVLYMQKGRGWAWLCALSNSLIVAALVGPSGLALYFVFVVVLSLVFSDLLIRMKSVEKSTIGTLFAMGASAALVLAFYAQMHHVNFINEIQSYVASKVDTLASTSLSGSSLVDPADLEELKQHIVLEFPSFVAILSLIFVWINFVILFFMNPNKMRERVQLDASLFKKWKAPEHFIWPTIISGFFLLINFGTISDISVNVFKFLMSVYALQGLSVFCYFFDAWGLKGLFRLLGYSLPLLFMTPLVLCVGFFDLWFDFRSKFRQS